MRRFSRRQNHLHKGEEMFDTVLQDIMAIFAISALWFVLGRMVGIRVGYLKGRRAVRDYYESRDKVRV